MPSPPSQSHEKLFLHKNQLKSSHYDSPFRAAAWRKLCQLLKQQWYHCSARYNSTSGTESKLNSSSCAVDLHCLSWLPAQQEAETWWRERKKPKPQDSAAGGIKDRGSPLWDWQGKPPGRCGSSRGRNTGLKDYWELWGTVVSGGHQQPRALRGGGWCAWAGQDWGTEGKDKGTAQLTQCGQCGVCMRALR